MAMGSDGDQSREPKSLQVQPLNHNAAAMPHLDCNLIAFEQAHADERRGVNRIDGNTPRLSIPHDYGFVDVEGCLAPVR